MSDTSLVFYLLAKDGVTSVLNGVEGNFNKSMIAIGAGAVMAGEKMLHSAADYESSTSRLVTSAGETHANLDLVRRGMLDMTGQVGDSASELSRAMYTIESGGRHGAEGLDVLRAAAEGAKAEGADLTTVSDALTSVLQDYHLKGSDAALVTSQMVAAVGAGKTTFEQFAGSLSAVLPIASSSNISFQDISAAIASMTVHGMSAQQASQNLSDVIRHMTAPTQVQTKELAQLGMSSGDLAGMLGKRGLTGTLQDLSELIIKHMGPSGKVMLDAFNQSKDAARDANTMVAAMPKNLQGMARAFQENKVTFADWRLQLKALPPEQANLLQQFATLQNRATGFNDILKSGSPAAQSYQDALRRVTGDATGLNVALMLTGENTGYVNDTLKTISGATTEAGNHVAGWGDVQKTFNQKLAEFKDEMGAIGIKIGTVMLPKAKEAIDVAKSGVEWFGKHKDVAKDLAIGLGVLAGAWAAHRLAVIASNVATATWTVLTGAAKVATTAWTGVVYVARGAMWAWTAAQGLGNSTAMVWIGVQAIDFAAWVRKAAMVSANTVALGAHAVAMGVVKVATLAWTAVQWALNVAMDANPIGLIVLAVAALALGIWWLWNHSEGFRKFFIHMWNEEIWPFLKGIGHWFANDFADFFVKGYHWVMNKGQEAHDWIVGKWNAMIDFVTGIPGKISSAAHGMWDGITDAFRGALNWIIDRWNGLQFKIPSFSFLGITTPGFTLGVPHIPHLAAGGYTPATAGGRLAVLGEAGQGEFALPESKMSALLDRAVRAGRGGGGSAGGRETVWLRPGNELGALLIQILRAAIGARGGKTTVVLDS